MAKLRVPSLQHLSRNWRSDPNVIARDLVRLAQNPPRFNYNPLHSAVRDLLVLGVPYEQIVKGICREKRERVRNNLLGVLPLIREHFSGISPDFYQFVDKRLYSVGRGLQVPFDPPMIYGIGGQLHFPWFSFWRSNPLRDERLSLFVTLVDEILMQDPDLETARFQILDFSSLKGESERSLTIIEAGDIPRVDADRKYEMLETFAEGYFQALAVLNDASPENTSPDRPTPDPSQLSLF